MCSHGLLQDLLSSTSCPIDHMMMGLCAHKLPKPKLHYNLLELGLPFVSSRFDKVVDPRKVHASVYISVPCWHVLVAPHVIGTLHAKLEVSSLTAALNGTLCTSDSTVLATKSVSDKTVSNKSVSGKTLSNKTVSDKTVSDTRFSAVQITWPPLCRICLLQHINIPSLSLSAMTNAGC